MKLVVEAVAGEVTQEVQRVLQQVEVVSQLVGEWEQVWLEGLGEQEMVGALPGHNWKGRSAALQPRERGLSLKQRPSLVPLPTD